MPGHPHPLLYSFRRCPYAMRARMALVSAGIQVEIIEVALKDKPADMLALSPKGTVPVLHLSDGRVLDESLAIMDWALAQNDRKTGWLHLPLLLKPARTKRTLSPAYRDQRQ